MEIEESNLDLISTEIPPPLENIPGCVSVSHAEIGSDLDTIILDFLFERRSREKSTSVLVLLNNNKRTIPEWFRSKLPKTFEATEKDGFIIKLEDSGLDITFSKLEDLGTHLTGRFTYDVVLTPKFSVLDRLVPKYSSGIERVVKFEWIKGSTVLRNKRTMLDDRGWWNKWKRLFKDPGETSKDLIARFFGFRDSDHNTEGYLQKKDPYHYSTMDKWSKSLCKFLACLVSLLLFTSIVLDNPRDRIR